MSAKNDIKNLVREIAKLVGTPEAKRLLVTEGISISVADKLVGNRYDSEVGLLIGQAVGRALAVAKQKSAS
jgi:hypothetical protein